MTSPKTYYFIGTVIMIAFVCSLLITLFDLSYMSILISLILLFLGLFYFKYGHWKETGEKLNRFWLLSGIILFLLIVLLVLIYIIQQF